MFKVYWKVFVKKRRTLKYFHDNNILNAQTWSILKLLIWKLFTVGPWTVHSLNLLWFCPEGDSPLLFLRFQLDGKLYQYAPMSYRDREREERVEGYSIQTHSNFSSLTLQTSLYMRFWNFTKIDPYRYTR